MQGKIHASKPHKLHIFLDIEPFRVQIFDYPCLKQPEMGCGLSITLYWITNFINKLGIIFLQEKHINLCFSLHKSWMITNLLWIFYVQSVTVGDLVILIIVIIMWKKPNFFSWFKQNIFWRRHKGCYTSSSVSHVKRACLHCCSAAEARPTIGR